MQSLQEQLEEDKISLQHSKVLSFPEGLPAFEHVKEFILVSNESEAPFFWLQAVSEPNLAFVTIDPFLIYPGYRPDVCDEDCEFLKLSDPKDALVLSIVNLKNSEDQGVTANLVGPIVVNWKEKVGKQVIIQNHLDYSVRFRIDEASS